MMMVIANIAAMMIATDDSITNEHLDGVAGKCQRPPHFFTAIPLAGKRICKWVWDASVN